MAEIKSLIDRIIDAPEGYSPSKLHILFDKKTRSYAEQYETALKVSRGIPFNVQAISVTDPLVIIVANTYKIKEGAQAIRQTIQFYEKWALDAQKHGWMLAILADNDFTNEPTAWENADEPPPGIPYIPEPKYNLQHPTEARLKQIVDYLSQDIEFQGTVMTAVNDAMVNLVNEVEETDKVTGFLDESASADLHGETSTPDNTDVAKSGRRTASKK